MREQNRNKEEPPNLIENQIVYLKPNIRTKNQPRGKETQIKDVTVNTFKNSKNIKRNKKKIKRVKN